MKHIFTLALVFVFSVGLMAQQTALPVAGNGQDDVFPLPASAKVNKTMTPSKSLETRWYSYAETMDLVNGGLGYLWYSTIFPDTTISYDVGGTLHKPGRHSFGNMFDPTFDFFNDAAYYPTGLKVNQYMSYSLDSLALLFRYVRNHPNPNIVDTLRFQVAMDTREKISGTNFPPYILTGANMLNQWGEDTVNFKAIRFNASTLKLNAPLGYVTYDVILNSAFYADSIGGNRYWAEFATPEFANIPANYVVGTMVTFIPGYSWIANADTLDTKNSVGLLAYEENGQNTYPLYFPGSYNVGYIGNDAAHFDPSNGWYQFQIPGWAWLGEGFAMENQLFYYRVTADMSGVPEIGSDMLTIRQNYPNPAQDATTIEFSLAGNSNVLVSVFDITGSQVMSLDLGSLSRGTHQLDLDVSTLNSGMYYFTIEAGNKKLSRKMVVQH